MSADKYSDAAAERVRVVVALGVGWGDGVSTGGDDGQQGGGASLLPAVVSAGYREPAAESSSTGDHSAAGPWPSWAVPQLHAAVEIARRAAARRDGTEPAVSLYREWYAPAADRPAGRTPGARPLAGVYRRAHAGSSVKVRIDGVMIVDRQDVVGRDGWWRTWGDAWRPLRSRRQSVRVLLTPRTDALAPFVSALTAELRAATFPWLLACPTDPRGTRRAGSAVLHVPDADCVAELLPDLMPLLEDTRPPLSLPLAPGVGLATDPDNGMTFGEHRCHLIALALGLPSARHAPLDAIAYVFGSHGIDPAAPYREISCRRADR